MGVDDYNVFCRNEKGEWVREKEYQWTFEKLNAEYAGAEFGHYARLASRGDDTALVTAMLFEAGLKVEGIMTPLIVKNVFGDEQDATEVYEVIKSIITPEQYQALLDKYCGIKAEFLKRHKAHQEAINAKSNAMKPKVRARKFRVTA